MKKKSTRPFRLAAVASLLVCASAMAVPTLPLDSPAIDQVFKAFTAETPGCALGLYQEGKLLYAKGYGLADLNHQVPIRPDTVFDIGSTSKQFTALAVLMLQAEGKLSLQDEVSKHLPELKGLKPAITLEQMLHHTAGLRDYNELLMLAGHFGEDVTTADDALQRLAAQRGLNFTPGARFSYSNSGYFLAALIVERVSGQSLDAFLQARVFQPLGMKATHVRSDHNQVVAHRASAYSPTEHGFAIDMSNWDQVGDGAVQTTVQDLALWDGELARPRVVDAKLLQAMQQPGRLNDGQATQYGLGLGVDNYRGLPRIQHSGAWGGYRAMFMRFPAQQLGLALTCNAGQANPLALSQQVVDIVLADQLAKPAELKRPAVADAAPAGFEPQRFEGVFFDAENSQLLKIKRGGDGQLKLQRGGSGGVLMALSAQAVQTKTGITTLTLSDDAQSLSVQRRDEAAPRPFKRLPAYQPQAADLAALVGHYRSAELDTQWQIRLQGQELQMKARNGQSSLTLQGRDLIEGENAVLTLRRDAKGALQGFVYDSDRSRGIVFERR
ncbi:serine hydrolase domain-containing protein [Paucibacter sp. APW11]|uniref:Serine hydrolase domain-containing protein n=1 Tax=Roseateles aquae TaxID=3077235 RepID=A0ABU3PIB4_9BURK|nr:serine hydrolase domain-containing protein [Paucibacter sp. APW11]MDT9002316.1 serine hydrolase domain-containing protein [Paucibacter sp. APW11]